MRKWAVWCIKHRMSWAVHLAMILSIPLYVVVGACVGVKGLMKQWISDWKSIRRSVSAQRAAAQKGE